MYPLRRPRAMESSQASPPQNNRGPGTTTEGSSNQPDGAVSRPRERHPALSRLIELKWQLGDSVPKMIGHLQEFDRNHGRSLTNAQIISPFARMNPDAEMHFAMRRKASFLMISDVLEDINSLTTGEVRPLYHSVVDDNIRLMLTAQVHALQKQVFSNRTDAFNKVMHGKRICPLTMQSPGFDHFIQRETAALQNLTSLCSTHGPKRSEDISNALSEFAQRYLGVTNRQPAHLKRNQSVTYFNEVTLTDCSVGVWLFNKKPDSAMNEGVVYEEHYGEKHAVIFIEIGTLTHPYADPAKGDEFHCVATAGFEHCSIPQKQAAVFLLGLFYELGDLEIQVAIDRGKSSFNPREASLAHETEQDAKYKGLVQFGDRFDEHAVEPDNQRSPAAFPASQIRPLALAYREAHRSPLLTDPELEKWLINQRFAYDMDCVHNPECRMWMMNVDFAKQALLRSPAFAPRQNRFQQS